MNDIRFRPCLSIVFFINQSHAKFTGVTNAASFGNLLREARKRAGLSQAALASKCRITQSYLNRLETSTVEPPGRDLCRRIANAIKMDVSELWKHAFLSRARRWLSRQGYADADAKGVLDLFQWLEDHRKG